MLWSVLVSVHFTHILQGYYTSTGDITRSLQCHWTNIEWYGWVNHINLLGTYKRATKQSTTQLCAYSVSHTAYGIGMNKRWSRTLIHWGGEMHICIGTSTNISSDNGLSPGRRQAIIWTNAGILLIGPLGTNFSGILSKIHTFSLKKMHFKTSSAK